MELGISPLLLQPHCVGRLEKSIPSTDHLVPPATGSLYGQTGIWRQLALPSTELSPPDAGSSSQPPSALGTKQPSGMPSSDDAAQSANGPPGPTRPAYCKAHPAEWYKAEYKTAGTDQASPAGSEPTARERPDKAHASEACSST